MEQTKLESAIESTVNIATGFVVAYLVWMFIVPVLWPQHASSHSTAIGITFLFSTISWVRSYVWRRVFENQIHKKVHRYVYRFYG